MTAATTYASPTRLRAANITRADVAVAAAVLFALALPVQATAHIAGMPIRIAVADLLTAGFLPFLLAAALRRGGTIAFREAPLWAGLLVPASAVMTYGFLIGASEAGAPGGWALTKYLGWYALLATGASAALLAAMDPRRAPRIAAAVLIAGLCAVTLAYVALAAAGRPWPLTLDERLSGLMDNPNAFALVALCGLALQLAMFVSRPRAGLRLGEEAVAALLCAGVLFTRSLAAAAGLAAILMLFVLLRRRYFGLVRVAAMTAAIFAAPSLANKMLSVLAPDHVQPVSSFGIVAKLDRAGGGMAESFPARLESGRQALSAWAERPLLGIGLGTFWRQQQAEAAHGAPAVVIHSTPLWLLAEFGLVGLGVFAALIAAFAVFLYRAMIAFETADPARARAMFAGLLVMAGWAAMSLAHEMMYQRVPWFVLGLCAGAALMRDRAERAAS